MANRWNVVGKSVPEITSSTSTTDSSVTATLSFEVTAEYPDLEAMGIGEYARSGVFTFGGYDWGIEFYPHGWGDGKATAYLCFLSLAGHAHSKYTLSVLGDEGEEPLASFDGVFSPMGSCCPGKELKPLTELVDGGFTLQYVLTIFKNVSPPMELPGDLERMLRKQRGTDITFRVCGREFSAHSFLLAERSPVFKAQLFGPMAEKDMARIEVVDMEPAIFQMLLHYIYTDILPSCNDQGGRTTAGMQQLLVAADRYGLDRLKLMCEEELCGRIDEETIMSTYALANRHHCNRLKHACLLFLMQSPDVLGTVLKNSGFNELCMTNYLPSPLKGDHVPGTNKRRSHPEEETDPGKKLKRTRYFFWW
ncbi:BTB/POZ and MATH domain-containing protein 2-like [Triticum dicoccoides]|uniref:BTB/POZ and MATH domain-containing protein 2-like n=1 Tax=Triticum dicoccoides TaxID=85692 RepID=UPI00189059C7|nr:BTB/POZ and MATH domain-containing protein 2-like [Triticum dicoccoides]